MSPLPTAARSLAEQMAEARRGPRRDALFGLWLTLRVIQDLPVAGVVDRPYRRRVALLSKRLSSLTMAPGLKRALMSTVTELETADRSHGQALLTGLAAAVRDPLGAETAEVLQRAARGFAGP
ncbi:MAG: hypothetical protein KF785_07195 [Gemmatimonadales bacterium]|nr:hypothetical protein [Gemmatimonadales bacterium]